MSKVLSVIIPSYNVERFLNHTIQSFLAESILDQVELLVVDDGSVDRTAAIAEEFQAQYPKTVRKISKENGGHGSTINKGIEVATGRYFKVVDGDDWVNTVDFVKLVNALEHCDSDYVLTNYYEYFEDIKEQRPVTFQGLQSGETYPLAAICEKRDLPMHALVMKTALLKSNQILLDEKCFYVDVEYVLFPIPFAKTVTFFDFYVYMYRLALDTQSVSIKGFQKHVADHERVTLRILGFINAFRQQKNPEPAYMHFFEKRAVELVCTQSMIYSSFSHKDPAVQKMFKAFDRKVLALNPTVYQRSSAESKKLYLLRKTHFHFYRLIQALSSRFHR